MIEGFKNYIINIKGLSENSYLSYNSDIKQFENYYLDYYGEELTILTHQDIIAYKTYLLNRMNRSVSTINRMLASLKNYNEFLVETGVQNDIVILDRDYIKVQNQKVAKIIPSEKEINKLKHFSCKDSKHSERDYCIIVLASHGGFRVSELVNIKISDIILEERYIKIIGKGNKFRRVIISDVMLDALTEYLKIRLEIKTESPYLFVGQKTNSIGGKPLNRNFFNRTLDKYNSLCKISKLHPHILRAYFCRTAIHKAGYSYEQVASQARSS